MSRQGYSRVIGAATGTPGGGWFGDGSDGDLIIPDGVDYVIPVAEDTGHIFKQYRNVTVGVGATLRPSHRCNGMLLFISGNLINNGWIKMDKMAPLWDITEEKVLESKHIRLCNLIGGAGGAGGRLNTGSSGIGGVGGLGHAFGGGYGGGGFSYDYDGRSSYVNGGNSEPRPPYGIVWPYRPTTPNTSAYGSGGHISDTRGYAEYTYSAKGGKAPGGSGAGGYQNPVPNQGGHAWWDGRDGDAYGGGALWIFVKGNTSIGSTGKITANGGNGANFGGPPVGHSGSGGGGGGGVIALIYGGSYNNAGTITAHGGLRGVGGSTSDLNLYAGINGSVGPILTSSISELI